MTFVNGKMLSMKGERKVESNCCDNIFGVLALEGDVVDTSLMSEAKICMIC